MMAGVWATCSAPGSVTSWGLWMAGAEMFILVIPSFLCSCTLFSPHTVLMMLLPMCSKSSPHSHKHTVFSSALTPTLPRTDAWSCWEIACRVHGLHSSCPLVLCLGQIRAGSGAIVTMGLMQPWSLSIHVPSPLDGPGRSLSPTLLSSFFAHHVSDTIKWNGQGWSELQVK